MRRAILFVMVVAALPVSGAPAPWPRSDRRPDLEQLQGEWELMRSVTRNGQTHRWDLGELRLTITRRRYCFRGREGKGDEGLLTLGQTSRPKWIDFGTDAVRSAYPTPAEATTADCIYRLEGNVLTVRCGDAREGRPTDFTSPPTSKSAGTDIYVYKRKARGQ